MPADRGRGLQVQLIDDGLHRHVAGQIPAVQIQQRVHKVVPEHAVKHHMQVVPHRAFLLLTVIAEKRLGIVVDAPAVRGQQTRRGRIGELAQGRV